MDATEVVVEEVDGDGAGQVDDLLTGVASRRCDFAEFVREVSHSSDKVLRAELDVRHGLERG